MRQTKEHGAAVTDFVMVGSVALIAFLAVVQLGLALHARNTLVSCAAEGARYGARVGSVPSQGAERTKALVAQALSARYARRVTGREVVVNGVRVVEVTVVAPLPVVGLVGPGDGLDVVGRAFVEEQ